MFQPGLAELVVGKNANTTYGGLTVGNTVVFGGGHWKVVGVFDAGGSAFDSEIWCDARSSTTSTSAPVTFSSPLPFIWLARLLAAIQGFADPDPRLNVDVSREIDYYAKQSTRMTTADHRPRRTCRRRHGHRRGLRRAQHHVLRRRRTRPRNRHHARSRFRRRLRGSSRSWLKPC